MEFNLGDATPSIRRKPADTRWDGRITDMAFRSSEPGGPSAGEAWRWWYWWDSDLQDRFRELWSQEGDDVADDLAERYWFSWPWVIGPALVTAAPTVADRIIQVAKDPSRPGPKFHPRALNAGYESIATWGSFQVVLRRRTWEEPHYVICPVCEIEFWSGSPTVWMIKKFGPVRYCEECCFRVYNGRQTDFTRQQTYQWSVAELKSRLQQLTEAIDHVPAQAFVRQPFPVDASNEIRDTWMRALVDMPDVATIKRVLGVDDWLGVLRAADIIGETWRPSRGTWCRANDGHRCRSLLEKSIDDWFVKYGIAHECEPHWPAHPILNPKGLKRADWLLADGTYVECAGMIDQPDYAAKIAAKRELASQTGISLIVVGPTDLHRLETIFKGRLTETIAVKPDSDHFPGIP